MKPAINAPNFGNYHHETLAPWIDTIAIPWPSRPRTDYPVQGRLEQPASPGYLAWPRCVDRSSRVRGDTPRFHAEPLLEKLAQATCALAVSGHLGLSLRPCPCISGPGERAIRLRPGAPLRLVLSAIWASMATHYLP